MAASSVDDELSLISRGLYRIVSDIVGPECIVVLRRQKHGIRDAFSNCDSYTKITRLLSGSKAEGFDFKSSDYDVMYIDRNAIVCSSDIRITTPMYSTPTILIMDTENVSPGFAFIRCLRYDQNNETLKHSLVFRRSGVYVSSKQIRESFLSTSMTTCHGPCQTRTFLDCEGDFAYTLRCPVWPKEAMKFINRSLRQGWPSYDTLTQICKNGCLLVPINSKQQQYNDMADLQWRISFSLAEKKLVYSMNHSQFLCYGLSKLLLNEVLKKASPNEDLLCSYFMKTAVFWTISEDRCDWSPSNFLSKFWKVFCRLIRWVSIGYCPNFFIPENNMFQGKIFGDTQATLLGTIRDLYMDGYWSLLRCPSLHDSISKLITQPEIAYTLSCDELEYVPLQMYMAGNYHRTIEMIHYTRHKLQSQLYMYEWTLDDDVIMTVSQQGMSYDTVVKSLIVSVIKMNENTSIEELKLECLAFTQTVGVCVLYIPPLVFLNFLLVLSYNRISENHRQYDILDELNTLLYHDDCHHIATTSKAISWEILGICQQLCGYRHGAYQSYLHALDDEYNYFNMFKQATVARINSLGTY
ncbi:hypothetical protein FSP39_018859 [Pinctada imbricata]|uniref:Uncharacterized protein n=1 Tax=Pinctada imbricata TaxID=66713 RepID=A0AA88XTH4_PINIB|nr:hypothetical protein FSP39_018859 [Pinctada imbricata]